MCRVDHHQVAVAASPADAAATARIGHAEAPPSSLPRCDAACALAPPPLLVVVVVNGSEGGGARDARKPWSVAVADDIGSAWRPFLSLSLFCVRDEMDFLEAMASQALAPHLLRTQHTP